MISNVEVFLLEATGKLWKSSEVILCREAGPMHDPLDLALFKFAGGRNATTQASEFHPRPSGLAWQGLTCRLCSCSE